MVLAEGITTNYHATMITAGIKERGCYGRLREAKKTRAIATAFALQWLFWVKVLWEKTTLTYFTEYLPRCLSCSSPIFDLFQFDTLL